LKRLVLVPSALALVAAAVGASSSMATAAPVDAVVSANLKLGNPASAVTINEDGSSLLSPYLTALSPQVKAVYPNVTLTSAAGGSGKGVSDATSGVVQMGGSDAYLPPADFTQFTTIQNIPIVVANQSIDYNLKGITNLKLSGNVIAQIYQGKITTWNNSAITKLNPGVKLPAATIVPIVRSDSSGDTFNFTSFLSATNSAWSTSPGFNTSVTWPSVSGELTATGNPGMVQTASKTANSIVYVGSSAEASAKAAKLGQAKLQNASGSFVLPTAANVTAAVNASKGKVPANLAASLIYAKGATSYPIVNFEYLIVKGPQSSPAVAQGVRDILAFAINTKQGSSPTNLAAQGFVPLPTSVVPLVQGAIAKVD
jgi:phosphate transport system substrate-binding protein